MVDREARNRIAEATRHFVAGLSTNFEFDDSVWAISTTDRGVKEIRWALWTLYSDFRTHKLKPTDELQEVAARILLFLKSDCEYSWPAVPRWYPPVRALLCLLSLDRARHRLDAKYRDMAVWPFLSVSEADVAREHPRYLAGSV